MPSYRLLCLAKPDTSPSQLTTLFRNVARIVYREKGQLRAVENLGVRPLAYPARVQGERFDDARWVEARFDVSPPGLSQVQAALRTEEAVLRHTALRARAADGMETGEFRPFRREKEKLKYRLPPEPAPITDLLKE